jgi:hypothetical protein
MTSRKNLFVVGVIALAFLICGVWPARGQSKVATVDAGLGSCKASFTVKDGAGKPIYNSKISVLIKYGFMNLRQTDLEAYTNEEGEARFTGLPNFPKKPLAFNISSGTVSKTITDDPNSVCSGVFDVTLTVH